MRSPISPCSRARCRTKPSSPNHDGARRVPEGSRRRRRERPAHDRSRFAPIPTTVEVALGARSYDIVIGRGLIASLGARIAALRPGAKAAIVTDENVARHHLAAAEAALADAGIAASRVIVPAGEGSKSFRVFEQVCEAIIAARIERGDLVVALGGGVIGDLAGFAASVVRRGLDYVQVPTTLLAQVDSSVGGKTAINSAHGKNLVGAFHQPILVVADTALLDTLPPREFRAGYAEVAKYGLLGDAAFFSWLEANWRDVFAGGKSSGSSAREHAIAVSCRAKAAIVARDERETGERALLNLGHTFGHALEAACGFSDRLLHGEAVAAGMALAFGFSARLGLIAAAEAERAIRHLAEVGLADPCKDIPGSLPGVGPLDGADGAGQESEARNAYIYSGARDRRRFVETRRRSSAGARVSEREACRAMSIYDWLTVAAVVICLLVSAFFSASETALTGVVARRHDAAGEAGQRRRHHRQPAAGDARAVARRAVARQQRHQYRRLDAGDRPVADVVRRGRRHLRHRRDDGC